MVTSAPIFPSQNYFRWKIFENNIWLLLFSLELGWFWSPKRTTFPIWQSLRACFLIISIFSLWYNQLFQITIEETFQNTPWRKVNWSATNVTLHPIESGRQFKGRASLNLFILEYNFSLSLNLSPINLEMFNKFPQIQKI